MDFVSGKLSEGIDVLAPHDELDEEPDEYLGSVKKTAAKADIYICFATVSGSKYVFPLNMAPSAKASL